MGLNEKSDFERKVVESAGGDPEEGYTTRPGHTSVTGFAEEVEHRVGIDGRPYICRSVYANIVNDTGLHLHSPGEDHHHAVAPNVERVLVSRGCPQVDEFPTYDLLPFDVPEVPAADPEGRFTLSVGDQINARRADAFQAARTYAKEQRDEFWAKVDARRAEEAKANSAAATALEGAGLEAVSSALIKTKSAKAEVKTEATTPGRARRIR